MTTNRVMDGDRVGWLVMLVIDIYTKLSFMP